MITGEELDKRMRDAGMVTVTERMEGSPLDTFMATVGVVDIDSLFQWMTNQRRQYMEQIARHDLGIHVIGADIFDFVLGKSAIITEAHINLRNVMGKEDD